MGITQPSSADFQAFFEQAPGLHLVLDPQFRIVAASNAWLTATMTKREEVFGRDLFHVFPENPDDPASSGERSLRESLHAVLETKRAHTMPILQYDIRRPEEEGGGFEMRYWTPVNTPLLGADGTVAYIINRVEDVTDFVRLRHEETERRAQTEQLLSGVQRMEAEIFAHSQEIEIANRQLEAANASLAELRRQADEKTALLMATARDAKFVLDAEGRIVEANHEAERILARPSGDLIGCALSDFIPVLQKADGLKIARQHASDTFVDLAGAPVRIGESNQFLFIAREVADRVKLEEQLRQSQKLEAIGQLTGGVAHDFNNLLTVIATTSEMLSEKVADQPRLTALVEMIAKAADRGASLTHRMLAFARRQPLQPRAVDLNELVSGMSMMLTRTLGEHITLSTHLAPDLSLVLADPSQIDDALLNLAINARDAMPQGGQLIIETANVHFSVDDIAVGSDLTAGDYVSLVISDTGHGMSAETVARAVEPFFTTKEVGHGTGLGLSMVYGFVKQSRGHIVIYSEVGFGTSIKLFLPRAVDATAARAIDRADASPAVGRGETILVVEDDVDVRTIAIQLLTGLGYVIRAAEDGPSAMRILRAHDDIDLLFTDLMMPGGMSGVDLLRAARQLRPDLNALITSGYPAQMIEQRGAALIGAPLIGKPYRKGELARAIRNALDGARG